MNSDFKLPESFGFQWHITDRCAGRCLHCYQHGFGSEGELSCDELKQFADLIMNSLPVPVSINLTGGEPLLYPRFFELASHIGTFDNLEELNIITSGTVLDKAVMDHFAALPKLTSIKISLESHIPEVNDSIRGRGHFRNVLDNIALLLDAGYPVVLMVTLGAYNHDSVAGLCTLAGKIGVSGVIFERYVPLGRGMSLKDNVLSSRQWAGVVGGICNAAEVDVGIEDLLPYKAFWVDMNDGEEGKPLSLRGALCNLGSSSMALMPDGTVFPCRRLPLGVGKIPDDSVFQILGELQKFSPSVLKSEMNGSGCFSCGHEECAGCRALALALGGELLGEDIQCPIDNVSER
ncbi:MAG: radical SAM/SPASM domain-containing protein [Chitinispirillaceae bacterium]